MIKLPLADKAYVPAEKILEYLLNLQSRDGRGKAIFFRHHGFHEENWRLLEEQLVELAQREPVVAEKDNGYGGKNYEIDGVIGTPQGRLIGVKSIWCYDPSLPGPKLISAFALKEGL